VQTQKVAKRLKNEKIDFIYSSDLKRASDTAKEIAKYHPHISIKLTQELRERNY
jgi:broad specificity phosphatase PhoE